MDHQNFFLVAMALVASVVAGEFFAAGEVILSAAGILTPVTGALWHNFGSIFVVVNAALLLRYKDEQ